jgi:hypothetical protein
MLKVLGVGGLLLVIGSRVIGVRVIGARSPRYGDAIVILTLIAQELLVAFIFAWVGVRVAADDPLRLAIAVFLFIISAFQALLAAVNFYVFATGRWRELADN